MALGNVSPLLVSGKSNAGVRIYLSMKTLITGAGGLLGRQLADITPNLFAYDHAALDVTDEAQVWRVLTNRKVDVVFHCAAMTDVDGCERDPARARRVNAVGAKNVASICASLKIYLVVISTDYVFDGRPGRQILEDSAPKPLSVYGRTKLEGEVATQDVDPGAAIVRTSWLYGSWRETFTDRILAKGSAGEQMSISSDQISSPTWVKDLAPALARLASKRCSGIYHLTGEGAATRDEWARAILESAGLDSSLVNSVAGYPADARRPKFSALTNTRARHFGVTLPPWRDSVQTFVESLTGGSSTETVA